MGQHTDADKADAEKRRLSFCPAKLSHGNATVGPGSFSRQGDIIT